MAPYLSSYIPAHTRNCYVLRSKPAIKQLVARTERYQYIKGCGAGNTP